MDPLIHRETIHLNETIGDKLCAISCTLEDSINFETGDAIELTSIDSIISEDGQMIHTKTLSAKEFKLLTRRARRTTFL